MRAPLLARRHSSSRAPGLLVALSAAVAVVVILPLVFLLLQAAQAGWHDVFRLLFRRLTATLLENTVELAAAVSAACAVLGTGTAWLVERTELPGARLWSVLLVIPVAIPDFVVGYAWHSIAPSVAGFGGALLVMSLALYPLVYLPVAASLRRADPAEEQVARSLGLGPVRTFASVTLRQIRPALTGGCLLVCLALLAEYGAFEIVRFQTFTTTIFTELQLGFDPAGASGLSVVLVIIALVVLVGEGAVNSRGRVTASGRTGAIRHRRRRFSWRGRTVSILAVVAVVGAALGLPIGTLAYWMSASHSTTLPGSSLWGALLSSATYSGSAALIATAAALPVALLAVRFRTATALVLERSTFIVQALPGIVIALALVFFSDRFAQQLTYTSPLLVAAYSLMFFPLALVCVRASVAQASRTFEEVARSLGARPAAVLVRVTLPLVLPGLVAAFCLVFLTALTELTATLLLVPAGVHTLATQFWALETNTSYGAAAPYAVVMVAVAAVPSYILTAWFDRRPSP